MINKKENVKFSCFPHKMGKKGLSPVVATILLVALVVTIGFTVFLWFNNLTEEVITKFDNKNIKLVCDDVQFQAGFQGMTLSIFNSGNVPIYNMKIKVGVTGNYQVYDLSEIADSWPSTGLGQGQSFAQDISTQAIDQTKIIVIPELIGSSKEGDKTYVCEERYGQEFSI